MRVVREGEGDEGQKVLARLKRRIWMSEMGEGVTKQLIMEYNSKTIECCFRSCFLPLYRGHFDDIERTKYFHRRNTGTQSLLIVVVVDVVIVVVIIVIVKRRNIHMHSIGTPGYTQ